MQAIHLVATRGIKNASPFVSGAALRTWLRDRGLKHDADDRYADGNDVGNGLGMAPPDRFSCSWDCGLYQVPPFLSLGLESHLIAEFHAWDATEFRDLSGRATRYVIV